MRRSRHQREVTAKECGEATKEREQEVRKREEVVKEQKYVLQSIIQVAGKAAKVRQEELQRVRKRAEHKTNEQKESGNKTMSDFTIAYDILKVLYRKFTSNRFCLDLIIEEEEGNVDSLVPTDEPTSKFLASAVKVNKNIRKLFEEKEDLATENEELMQLIEFMQLEDNITLEEDAALEEIKKNFK